MCKPLASKENRFLCNKYRIYNGFGLPYKPIYSILYYDILYALSSILHILYKYYYIYYIYYIRVVKEREIKGLEGKQTDYGLLGICAVQ